MTRPLLALTLATLLGGIWTVTAFQSADARPGFGGRTAHFNVGPHFNGPREFGQIQPRPPEPRPAPRPPGPEPKPGPKPGPGPGPKPGPGPHPPGPGPHPPVPPPPPIYPGYWPPPYPWYDDYRPWAVAAAAATTALAVGSLVAALPADCRAVVVNTITYQLCGSTWYAPRFSGNQLVYVVVPPPT